MKNTFQFFYCNSYPCIFYFDTKVKPIQFSLSLLFFYS